MNDYDDARLNYLKSLVAHNFPTDISLGDDWVQVKVCNYWDGGVYKECARLKMVYGFDDRFLNCVIKETEDIMGWLPD